MHPRAVKFADGSDDTLRILAIPYGGILNGRDTDGEAFTERTDLCLDWFPAQRPLLFEHGVDDGPGASVIGTVDSATATKAVDGVWVQAQLNKANRYYDSIKHLIDQGKLFASSGAMAHLVRRGKSGEITRWPWVELSLTPQPANLLAVVEQAEAAKHYKSAGLDPDALKAVWSTAEVGKAARELLAKAVLAGCEHIFRGYKAPIEQAVVVRAEHDDVLRRVVATIFPGHDMADIVGRFVPTAQRASVKKIVSDELAETRVARVDPALQLPPTHSVPVTDTEALARAVASASASPANLRSKVLEFLPAYLTTQDNASKAGSGRVLLLKGQLARDGAELGLSGPGIPSLAESPSALETVFSFHTDHNTIYANKSVWPARVVNDFPDSSFAYIEPGGEKDAEGKTTPRSLRHFPYKDAAGKPDAAHVRDALGRIPQSDVSQEAKDQALAKVRAAAKDLGIETAEEGKHAKAAVGATPAEGNDGDAPEGSCEDWIEDVCRAMNGGMLGQGAAGLPTGGYFCTVATFPDYAIVRWEGYGPDDDEGGDRFYRVELTKDDRGEPVLGKATPMELQYAPGKSSRLHLMPLALAAGIARKDADALLAHAKAVTQRRIEEGRKAMSDANRGHLQAEVDGLLAAARTLQTFLDSTKPQAKATPDVLRLLELRTRQHRQRMEHIA